MGKTKTKIIDDSKPVEEVKPKAKLGKQDDLVEKLRAELGAEEKLDVRSQKIDKEVKDSKLEEKRHDQTSSIQSPKPTSKVKHPTSKAKPRSKKYQEAVKDLDRSKTYPVNEAVELAQKGSYTKFPGSVELHINTAQKNLRGLVSLPFSTGKQLKIAAFGNDAKDSGADIAGDTDTIQDILKGKLNFDLVVTTPDWMPKLAPTAKILGPRGLMPNPKNGTITSDLKKTVAELKGGKTEYKTEANGQVVHLLVGKVNSDPQQIAANVKAIYNTLGRSKIKKMTLASTMGPGVKVDLTSI